MQIILARLELETNLLEVCVLCVRDQILFSIVSYNRFLNVKAVVAAFNQEKALVPSMGLFRDFRLREASFPALLATDTEPGEDDSTPSYELSPL